MKGVPSPLASSLPPTAAPTTRINSFGRMVPIVPQPPKPSFGNTLSRSKVFGTGFGTIQPRAGGGDVDPNQPYLVGEEGPELISSDVPATITPNDELASLEQPSGFGSAFPSERQTSMLGSANGQQPLPTPKDFPTGEQDIINHHLKRLAGEAEKASLSGDIVGLGKIAISKGQLDNHAQGFLPQPDTTGLPTSSRTSPGMPRIAPAAPASSTDELIKPTSRGQLDSERAMLKQQMLSPDTEVAGNAERRLAELNSQNPWGTAANHPGGFGKVMHGLAKAGNIAGDIVAPGTMANIPNTDMNRMQQRGQGLAEEAQGVENSERKASTANLLSEADTRRAPIEWKPAAGEQFTKYDKNGTPISQMWTNERTGKTEWRPLADSNAVQGFGKITIPQDTATGGGSYYGSKQQPPAPKFAETAVGEAGAKQYLSEAANAEKRLRTGAPAIAPLEILPTDTNEVAKEKVAQHIVSVNAANAQAKEEEADRRKIREQLSSEQRKQDAKDKNTIGYAENGEGKVVLSNKYNADREGQVFEEAKSGDFVKDRQAIRMLRDVQQNVSQYTKAATDYSDANAELTYNKKPVSKDNPVKVSGLGSLVGMGSQVTTSRELRARDNTNLTSLITKAGWGDINAAISAGGHVEIPAVTKFGQNLSASLNAREYNELSDQAKALYRGFLGTMAAVPAYQKALTGIGRTNKEMLDLELDNIAPPTKTPSDILGFQERFQANVDRAFEGYPTNLPGLRNPQGNIRDKVEGTSEEVNPDLGKYLRPTGGFAQWKQKQEGR